MDQFVFVDNLGFWGALSITLTLLGGLCLVLFAVRHLSNKKLVEYVGSMQFRMGALISVMLVIILSASLIAFTLHHNRKQTLNTVKENLVNNLNGTMDRLDNWIVQQQHYLLQLGRDPELVAITKKLLKVQVDPKALLNSQEQAEVRQFFAQRQEEFGHLGFFIINADYFSIASKRNINVGTKNLIARKKPELLKKVFSTGKVVLIPPLQSDVSVENKGKIQNTTMFFAAPIQDREGRIIAVFTQRLDPEGHLAQIMIDGRSGRTGETYLIDINGHIQTPSRFKQQLVQVGLLKPGEPEYSNLAVLDPGGNLLEGYKNPSPQEELPFTRMAKSIIQLARTSNSEHSQIVTDMLGYRDYRGVPVYGAWLWDKELNLGITSEIDVKEALSSFYTLRLNLVIVTGLTLFFSIAATLIAVLLGERVAVTLRRSQYELERKVAERTEWLRTIIDSAVDGIIVIDQKGSILEFSPAAEKIFGYGVDEVVGKNLKLLIPEPFSSEHDAYLSNYLETGQGKAIDKVNELAGLHKNGNQFPLEVSIAGVKLDGQKKFFTGIVRDISARKQAEQQRDAIIRELNFQKYALDMHSIVSIADAKGNIIYVNDRFCELSGYSRDELMGNNHRLVKSDLHPDSFYKDLWLTISSGNVWQGEICNLAKNNSNYWVNATIVPFLGENGKPERYISIRTDITQRKAADEAMRFAQRQAEAANRAKSEFLANMSHEIRTPMNAITGLSYLTLQTNLDRKQHNYLKKINDSANNLLGIINDILDFSKIEADKMSLEAIPFILDDVLANVTDVVCMRVREKGLELLIDKAPDIPVGLIGDPLRLGQVLINLANNAVKFTHQGEIIIRVERIGHEADDVILKFSVEDTGIGMTEEQVSRLFQSFSQADTSTTRKYGGTGLGLSISKRLINMMDGEIWVESEHHQGSSFNFIVRFKTTDQIESRAIPSVDILKGMNVLIADDRRTARDIMQHFMENYGAKTTLASNGQEVIEIVEQANRNNKPFKLLLIDCMMPKMTGIDAAVHIKTQLGLSPPPAIVMVTSYDRDEVLDRIKSEKLDGLIAKPVTEISLLETIAHVFGQTKAKVKQKNNETVNDDFLKILQGKDVLLVEDNEVNQMVAKGLLQKMNMNVDIAENGLIAVEKLQEKKYSAILMDLQMPMMDGYQATRAIREMPEFADLPIIAMTANAMESDKRKCLDAGMNAHVSKPINPKLLYSALTECLSENQAKQIQPEMQKITENKLQAKPLKFKLPVLPGINVEKGLRCVGGEVDFYQEMLLKFASNQKHTVENIKSAIEQDNIKEAIRFAHTLKGTAGTVGIDALMQQAAEVEAVLNEGNIDQAVKQLPLLEEMLTHTVELIETSCSSQSETIETAYTSTVLPENFTSKLLQLIDYLDQFNARASTCLDELLNDAQKTVWVKWLEKIQQPLSIYEFEEAAEKARALLDELMKRQ